MSVFTDSSTLPGRSVKSKSPSISTQHQNHLTCKPGSSTLDATLRDIEKCEDSTIQIAHLHLIKDTIESVVADNNGNLPSTLIKKMEQIIAVHDIEKHYKLPSNYKPGDDILTTLGIMDIPKPELTPLEKKILKSVVESEMMKKINSFIKCYENQGGSLAEAIEHTESKARQDLANYSDCNLPHWREKLDEMCNEYQRDIVICSDLLREWQKLRYKDASELDVKTAETKKFQAETLQLQARITKLKCAVKMFQETPLTLAAFRSLNHEIDEKLNELKSEVKEKTILLQQYCDLEGTEYDEILKRYSDLRTTIEKDERLLNNL